MDLTQLGQRVPLPGHPSAAVLEVVDAPRSDIAARFRVPEFTSLCPVTGAPDFGQLLIDYVPDRHLIESKSLKLFMGSFRSHGCFHEQIVAMVLDRLWEAAAPRWMRVAAYFNARGGIAIEVTAQRGEIPTGVAAPPAWER